MGLRNQEISLIGEVTKIMSKGMDFLNSVGEILKVLYSFWDVKYSYVAIYDAGLKLLKIVKAFGLREEEVEKGFFKRGEGIIGKVYKRGIPVVGFKYECLLNALSKNEPTPCLTQPKLIAFRITTLLFHTSPAIKNTLIIPTLNISSFLTFSNFQGISFHLSHKLLSFLTVTNSLVRYLYCYHRAFCNMVVSGQAL